MADQGRTRGGEGVGLTERQLAGLDLQGFVTNLVAATIGNIIGGAVLVGLVYWFVYLREPEP